MTAVRIFNQTTGRVLLERVEVAESARTRLVGLLGRAGLASDEGLLLVPCASIHMFFMRFAIDAAYLDASGRVVAIDQHLRPWRVGRVYKGVHAVLEGPAGAFHPGALQPGHVLVRHAAQP